MDDNIDVESSSVRAEEYVVSTLVEGDYHFGLAALVNSLAKHGFIGLVAAGYRGSLPPWIDQLRLSGTNDEYEICHDFRIRFIPLETDVHFTNMKPLFMRQLLAEYSNCKYIWYFDPDIVISCSWSFYVQWVKYGISLCEDVNAMMPANHPLRCRWIELVAAKRLHNPTPLSGYYNGGFVGLAATSRGFLDLWLDMIRLAEAEGLDIRILREGSRADAFYAADQDALNIAAMFGGYRLSTIGPEGMNFVPGGFTMFHAASAPKPWRKNMLLSALLDAIPPSGSDKAYLANAGSPIRPYSRLTLAIKLLGCSMGSLVGRFYRRN